jgi:peptide deformylase
MKLTKKTLKKVAKTVEFDYPFKVQKIGVEMFHLMKKEGGIGLAATQVGLNIRLFVTLVNGKYTAFYNPILLNYCTDLIEFDEGCLSFPGESYVISRPNTIRVQWQDYLGNKTTKVLDGLAARVWLHEYDHLEGVTFQQRLENTDIPESMQYVKE